MAERSWPGRVAGAEPSPRHLPSAEATGSWKAASTTRGAADRSRARLDSSKKASIAADKDAKRHQKALEKQFSKAMKQTEACKIPPPPLEEAYSPQPDLSPLAIEARGSAPEATFTPTAAGLCSGVYQGAGLSQDIPDLISEAISQGIAAGLQQRSQPFSLHAQAQTNLASLQGPPSPHPSLRSKDSLMGTKT